MIWYFSRGELSYGIYIGEVGNPNLFHREVVSLAKLSPGSSPRWIQPGYWDRGQLVSYWWIFRVRICCLFFCLFACFLYTVGIHFFSKVNIAREHSLPLFINIAVENTFFKYKSFKIWIKKLRNKCWNYEKRTTWHIP